MNQKRVHLLIASLGLLLFILACELPVATAPPVRSSPAIPLETVIAETAGAAQTQTLRALPPTETATATVPPTKTASLTPSPTDTVVIILPTWTPSITSTPTARSVGNGCDLVSQDPPNNQSFSRNANFEVQWTFRNSGAETWDHGDYDFEYLSGEKIHKDRVYDLPENVDPGGEVTLTVRMKAPEGRGSYTTTWGLIAGNDIRCQVAFKINVK